MGQASRQSSRLRWWVTTRRIRTLTNAKNPSISDGDAARSLTARRSKGRRSRSTSPQKSANLLCGRRPRLARSVVASFKVLKRET
jgi:hypothetical protein